eukprot:800738-Pyramimonas_sp.AAC.1
MGSGPSPPLDGYAREPREGLANGVSLCNLLFVRSVWPSLNVPPVPASNSLLSLPCAKHGRYHFRATACGGA